MFVTFDGAIVAWYTPGGKHRHPGTMGCGLHAEWWRVLNMCGTDMATELSILIEGARVASRATNADLTIATRPGDARWNAWHPASYDHVGLS